MIRVKQQIYIYKSLKNKTIRIKKIGYTNETPGLVFVRMLGKGKGMKKTMKKSSYIIYNKYCKLKH